MIKEDNNINKVGRKSKLSIKDKKEIIRSYYENVVKIGADKISYVSLAKYANRILKRNDIIDKDFSRIEEIKNLIESYKDPNYIVISKEGKSDEIKELKLLSASPEKIVKANINDKDRMIIVIRYLQEKNKELFDMYYMQQAKLSHLEEQLNLKTKSYSELYEKYKNNISKYKTMTELLKNIKKDRDLDTQMLFYKDLIERGLLSTDEETKQIKLILRSLKILESQDFIDLVEEPDFLDEGSIISSEIEPIKNGDDNEEYVEAIALKKRLEFLNKN